jgi:HD-GYP domain-containing protein (c-di-GMP phosphodiesterase class II)
MGIFAHAHGFGPAETEQCITGGLLHDLGQAFIDEELLERAGPLTPEEYASVKSHVDLGLRVANDHTETTEIIRQIILEHHERFDGSGYPQGLSGQDISIHGRMFSIVDTYDAVTNNRCYKSAVPSSAGMRTLLELSGSHFDQSLVHQFIKCMGVYPTGSLVKLSNGILAVVIAQTPGHPLKPLVRTIFSIKTYAYVQPRLLDLMSPAHDEKIVSYEDPGKYGINVNHFLPEEMTL